MISVEKSVVAFEENHKGVHKRNQKMKVIFKMHQKLCFNIKPVLLSIMTTFRSSHNAWQTEIEFVK